MPPSHEDMSKLPVALDQAMEAAIEEERTVPGRRLFCGGAFRPSILKPDISWQLLRRQALLAPETRRTLVTADLEKERLQAYDLLDRLTRSGCLPVQHCSLHVVLAPTHCFEKTLMSTLVEDSCNPLEPLERSALLLAELVHGRSLTEMLRDGVAPL
jgi:hypothetical protein